MNRLAVMDWGVGGLGFWSEWKRARPEEGVTYFTDRGFEPYGKLSDEELCARLEKVTAFLAREQGVTHLVIACNAASTVLDTLELSGMQVRGVIKAAAQQIRKEVPAGAVSICGGRRTIESGIYESLLPEHEVHGIVAQALSAAVEAGQLETAETRELVKKLLRETRPNLLLACTHYVALEKVITSVFPKVCLHDPIPQLVADLDQAWPEMDGDDLFLTTGPVEELVKNGKVAFGVEVTQPRAVEVL